ncbi:MAG: flagellar M-ring protein FliF [Deltaproteobacteria bacterium]|nr:flagellar M-ring protein FliF [Deltaproteobacteria bacterium]MCB9487243.1 flagellar M-ring protein FliF [Deltaproteobacteria bacterium]
MAQAESVFSQLSRQLSELSTGKKISFGIFLVLGVVVVLAVVHFSSQPRFRVLYSDLPAQDVAAIVEKLKADRVPYQITGAGSGVAVPDQQYYDIKMSLATEGLPQGGSMGFELFDRQNSGMTEFQQRITYQRALQGELARTIGKISAVEQARVHLALPKESLFKEDQREATASVVINLAPNAKLKEDEIEGIAFLVAGSVDGLEPENVNIMDARGVMLSRAGRDEVAGPINGQMMDYQRRMEANLEHRVVSMLARLVGPEKVDAKVTADLDFRQVRKLEERYDPDSQVARSESTSDESRNEAESNSAAGGAPGIDANLPNGAETGSGTQSRNSSTGVRETINYEISKVVSEISEPVGEIKRLSVAVMVDGTYVNGGEGSEDRIYKERTPEEMASITALVKNAIGYSEERGDQIEVLNVPFQTTMDIPTETSSGMDPALLRMIINYSLYGVMLLIATIFVWRMMRFLTAPAEYDAAQIGGLLPAGVGDVERLLESGGERTRAGQLLGEAGGRLLGGETAAKGGAEKNDQSEADRRKKLEEQRKALMDNAQKDQKAVALMVRKWLKEDHK